MLFNSLDYLLFYPVVLLFYFLIPRRFRYIWLLAASYYFYGCWSVKYALLMLISTLITFVSGLLIQRSRDKQRPGLAKLCVAGSFIINLAILGFFKYSNFLIENLNALLIFLGQGKQVGAVPGLIPVVGISFYTFQALSYTMDVYRQDVPTEKNVFQYALFVSFFPQLVAGPIERTGNLLSQLKEPQKFTVENARGGLLLIAWGLFIKVVLADNLARIVNPVYANYTAYSGVEIILATFAFAFQVYGDFAGYSYIARGSAEILGVSLMENFRCPYLAVSVADFWRRWHISLTTWFKDYLYVPLGGNRKGTLRKYVNTMIVFIVSGFWHGANWTFVLWGMMNGGLIILGEAARTLRRKAVAAFHINTESFSYTLCRRMLTFLLINFTWIFFRAKTLADAWGMLQKIFLDTRLPKLFSLSIFNIAINAQVTVVALTSMMILLFVDARKNRGHQVRQWVLEQGAPVRYGIYLGLMFAIILFGAFGNAQIQTQFIYFQF
ncbi:MAG: MBOAT family protein [Firmicutes bacterium]|nr:MBOAT family protein [Bacillota bacterium]